MANASGEVVACIRAAGEGWQLEQRILQFLGTAIRYIE
jgi:hypothetical protein